MNGEFVTQISSLAVEAAKQKLLGTHHPTYAHDGKIQSLELYSEFRSRFRGVYSTNVLAEFIHYVTAREVAQPPSIFIASEQGTATAFFNLGTVQSPGHADDVAKLKLRQTPAYAAMLEFTQARHGQRQMAEWLEDWAFALTPDSGLPIQAAIAAVRDITVTTNGELNIVQDDLRARRSALEEIEAKSKRILPHSFEFWAAPFDGLLQRKFELRLSVIPTKDAPPSFGLRVVGLAETQEAIALEFEAKVRDGLHNVNIYRGTFQP